MEENKFISLDKSNTTLEIEFEINYKNQLIKNKKIKLMYLKIIWRIFLIQEHFVFMKI